MAQVMLLMFLSLGSPDSGRGRGESPLDRVRREFPGALAASERFFEQVHGAATVRTTVPLGGGEVRTIDNRIKFAFDGPRRKMERDFTDESPQRVGRRIEVNCIGANSWFFLEKDPDSGDQFSLKGYGPAATSGSAEGEMEDFLVLMLNGEFIGYEKISNLIARPGFQFTDAVEVEEGVIRVGFKDAAPDAPVVSGTLDLLPERGWAAVRTEYFIHPDQVKPFVTTAEYGQMISGVPIPTRVVAHPTYANSPTREYVLDELTPGPTPEGAFTLASYGLPELETTGESAYRDHTALWLLGAAGAFLGLAWGASRLARRGASA